MSGQLFYEGVRIFIRNLSYLIAKSHAMKSNNSILIRSSVFAAVVVAAGLIAWQQPASANQQNRKDLITDTVPDKAKERYEENAGGDREEYEGAGSSKNKAGTAGIAAKDRYGKNGTGNESQLGES